MDYRGILLWYLKLGFKRALLGGAGDLVSRLEVGLLLGQLHLGYL